MVQDGPSHPPSFVSPAPELQVFRYLLFFFGQNTMFETTYKCGFIWDLVFCIAHDTAL